MSDVPPPCPESDEPQEPVLDNSEAARKVRSFPHKPGVYLMKDAAGRVIYVGKAKDLRSRAGSYFLKAAAEEPRTARLIQEIRDIDYLEAESEVDALLVEARLVKDIQPKFNKELKDDKTFPYLEIHTGEDFPRVEFTREPHPRGTKLYGPFANAAGLRGAIQVLQKIFRFRTCTLDIEEVDPRWRWYRPCLLHSIGQCTAPCNLRISKDEYRKDIRRLMRFLDGQKESLLAEMRGEMEEAARTLHFEEAARLRDEIELLENLDQRGELDTHVQPEVFPIDPQKGLAGLEKVLALDRAPRTIEGVDIAHLAGTETVASVVQFIDGVRRFQRLHAEGDLLPDILLIDGGRGQLNAALAAFASLEIQPPKVISLAKREELIFRMDQEEPLRLARNSYALRLLQHVRDEAHRFAQHYHHTLRRRTTLGEEGRPRKKKRPSS